MGQAIKIGGGQSSKINGMLDEYIVTSGGNVNAGDFVKFVNEFDEKTNTLDTFLRYTKATILPNNRVFILEVYSSRYSMYGTVCEINGKTITIGTPINILSTKSTNIQQTDVALLDNDRILITYSYYNSSNYQYYIVGTIFSIDADNLISLEGESFQYQVDLLTYLKAFALPSNKVVIFYGGGGEDHLYAVIGSIQGSNITLGTATLVSNKSAITRIVSRLSSDKFFIAFNELSTNDLYMITCHITDSLTASSHKLLFQNAGTVCQVAVLSENKVFLSFNDNSKNIHGAFCKYNNADWQMVDNVLINISSTVFQERYMKLDSVTNFYSTSLNTNNVFILFYGKYSASYNYRLYMVCQISNDQVVIQNIRFTLKKDTVLEHILLPTMNSQVLILDKKAKTGLNLYNLTVDKVKLAEEIINGIAKTKGNENQTVKIYTPIYEME